MQDLVALVTGGGSGIGFATAEMLLAAGAKVMIVGRNVERLKKATAELGAPDNQLKWASADVSSEGYANKVMRNTIEAFGRVDILINNAGVFRSGSLLDMVEEDFDYAVDGNLKATWLMCKFATRFMIQSGGGSIVNVSSRLAHIGLRTVPCSAYAAAKGGIISLTQSLAVELAPHKVRVNVVVPALVETPMLEIVTNAKNPEEAMEKATRRYPLGRLGQPEDVARAIFFLADPANSWITGMELNVDGGISRT
jgi:NAD(P)-dependent dehydrogenase (short-subunit alcohol dehydrogenase family)